MPDTSHFMRARGLRKRFVEDEGDIIAGIDLALGQRDRLAIVGRSGSGKSTLLYMLGLLDHPTAGTITWDGEDVSSWGPARAAALRQSDVGFVFQDHHLLPQCTALENVLVPCLARHTTPPRVLVERAEHLLGHMGLADRLRYRPHELSTGQRQRVAVARALLGRPRLLLADEPTGALDRTTAGQLMDLLLEVADSAAVVVVTHDMALAGRLGDVRRLEDGLLVDA
jgi:lipoprotein-releasing system ATP-binding protein